MSKGTNPFVQEVALSLGSNNLFLKKTVISRLPHEGFGFIEIDFLMISIFMKGP
jgi:hypothetical protein